MNNNLQSPLWAIHPDQYNNVSDIYNRQLDYYIDNAKTLNADNSKFNTIIDIDNKSIIPETFTISGGVGILPVQGVVVPKSDFFTIFFGGFAALDIIERDFQDLLTRDDIHTILLDIDSPGGNAFGVQQFANQIYNARQTKSIISVTSGMMASAAMWIGAAASKIFITGDVTITGSIGTVTTHTDISGLNKLMGVVQTEIAAGKFKRLPSHLEPLTDEGRAVLQDQVNTANQAFLTDIGTFRNAKPSGVRKMAEGKTFVGQQGIKVGLIDGIATMPDILKLLSDPDTQPDMKQDILSDNFNTYNKGKNMTLDEQVKELKSENIDLFNMIIEQGKTEATTENDTNLEDVKTAEHAKGVEAGKVEGIETGITKERDRITSLMELSNAASKTLIESFIADGKTTAPEAAVQILKAHKESNESTLKVISDGSPAAMDAEGVESDGTAPKKLRALVDDYMAEHKTSKGDAIKACIKLNPDVENDFIG